MIKKCEECGKLFETNRSSRRWCDDVHVRKCQVCGKEFVVSRQQLVDNKRCCSRRCSDIFSRQQNIEKLSNEVRYCLECGNPFTPTNNNQKYCTNDHYRPCPVCGKPVKVIHAGDLKNGIFRTCSKECESKYISKRLSESNIKQEVRYGTCIVCGKQFILNWPYNQKTCSSKCRGIYRKASGISKKAYEKAKQTNLERYGFENVGSIPKFIDKRDTICKERYGDTKVLRIEQFQEKSKNTLRQHYGVDFPCQHEEIKKKQIESVKARYGVDNYFKSFERIQSSISDPSKAENWIAFKSNPIEYIEANFINKPNIHDLCDNLGVTDTRIYDILIEHNGQSYIKHFSSIMESDVKNFLDSLKLDCEIIQHDRKLISPYEADFYIPKYNLAIECNPAITHNSSVGDQFGGDPKPVQYHKLKSCMCKDKGVLLFHIFGWEWKSRRPILESMLRNLLNMSDKIYARQCYIKESTYEETRNFLESNHRQGFASYKYSIGLYTKSTNQLVSLMTFGKLRNAQGRKGNDNNSIELLRFCNLLNTTVVGGSSKLFKYFVNNYNSEFDKIVSFSDIAHTSGKLYSILGFNIVSESDPGYVWVCRSNENMYSRIQCQKRNLRKLFNDDTIDIENKTERQIMLEHGYVQVFDSGVIRWEWSPYSNPHIS